MGPSRQALLIPFLPPDSSQCSAPGEDLRKECEVEIFAPVSWILSPLFLRANYAFSQKFSPPLSNHLHISFCIYPGLFATKVCCLIQFFSSLGPGMLLKCYWFGKLHCCLGFSYCPNLTDTTFITLFSKLTNLRVSTFLLRTYLPSHFKAAYEIW
jgi:hypothetical protein